MDPSELEQLIGRILGEHGAALRLYATTWSNAPDDCLQRALIKLTDSRPMPENIVGWLFRVVRNEAISDSRSNHRRRRREATVASQRGLFDDRPDNRFEADELSTALSKLTPDSREVVVAKIWGGLTFEEIGQAAGCSASAAHRRYQSGLEQMKKQLTGSQELEKERLR